jgi:hypothetical protein
MRRPTRSLLLAVALLGAGCSATLQGDTVEGKGFAFRVGAIPESWRRLDVSHATLAFRDERDGATVVVNARCGLDGEDVPLESLTKHLFLRFTEREIQDQRVLPFDHREAMRSVVTAKLDGVPMQFDVWVLKKDGCVYDFAYMAAPPRFPRGAEEFDRFVRGFSTVTPHAD